MFFFELILLCNIVCKFFTQVIIKFANKEIPKSPYTVCVEGAAGDPSKVTAAGPGLEKTGVIAGKKTYFEVFTKSKSMPRRESFNLGSSKTVSLEENFIVKFV